MTNIDDKVVSMKFDNVAFERNVSETLRSLEKLKQSLDFANSTRGMNDLSAASKNFNMHGMESAVEGIGAKFLALTTIGVTALATITSHAIESGARIVKGLSLQPVLDGYKEYETNINSIQTILANTDSKGTTLGDVNKALDQLNQYADQTIYNFSEMTRNIGTFTAAGVGLDTSVASIKGIANIAAISGSNSEQASTAMYQLSQAIASGTVKLMDWNSVVNAGMGGEVFQKALFEAGKAAKTLTGVPVSQTFDQWKEAGNTFRGSLESGWLTAEVLTNTLQGFTGDLNEAQIMALGYTKDQAAEVMRLGKIGKAAATEVKTLTQLIGTVKEAVGSGWSTSFRLIFGDFEEAKKLFTNVSGVIGDIVGKSADARNKMLKDWKDLGGRDQLLQGLENSFSALGKILAPIGAAFRDVFPATTGQRLFELTEAFTKLTEKLFITGETSSKIRDIFRGVFSVVEIGKTIIVEFLKFIGGLISNLSGVGGGALDLAAKFGVMLQVLNNVLVSEGGIHKFFIFLGEVIKEPIVFIKDLKEAIIDFFKGFSASRQVEEGLARIESRFESLKGISDKVTSSFQSLSGVFEKFRDILSKVGEYIRTWFSELGSKLAEAFKPGDFNAAVDIVNVGLLGGIILVLKKFVSGDFLKNFGGGLFEKVTKSLDQLTGTLKSMQAQVKAETLLKIAIALGILTASIVILSLIDSDKLATSLLAISIAFGELVGVLALLTKLTSGPIGAAKVAILAGSLILLSSAMVILSLAIKVLSTLSWEELAKGLVGIGVSLGLLIAAIYLLPPSSGLILTGIAMMAIASALLVLSLAVKSFSTMSWEELAKGLVGIGVALGLLTLAMNFMPVGSILAAGLAMIPLAVGIGLLAGAVKLFSLLSWSELLKGMIGIGSALIIIAGAMHLMPINLPITAAGLVLVGVALNAIALAVKTMSGIDFGSLAKGIGAIAVTLAILAAAMIVMTGTAAGAAAMLVASAALLIFAGVLKILGGISIASIATGLAAMAGVFIILGAAALILAPVVPVLFSLGAALSLLGVAFSLFGIGAMLIAKAFEVLAKAGKVGIEALIEVIKIFIAALPEFVGAFIKSIVELGAEILNAAPLLLRLVSALLEQILETVITLVPKIGEAIGAIISTGIKIIKDQFPDVLAVGFLMLTEFLRGIRDNISEITVLGVDIIVKFALSLTDNVSKLVDAGINLLIAFIKSISDRIGDVVDAGANLLLNFILGISDNISKFIETVTQIVVAFVTEIGNSASKFVTAGADALINFVSGIADNIIKIANVATDLVVKFISSIDDNALKIINAAADMVIDFMNGLADSIESHSEEFRNAGAKIAFAILDGMTFGFASKAKSVAEAAVNVAKGAFNAAKDFLGVDSPSKLFAWLTKQAAAGMAYGFDHDKSAKRSAVEHIENVIKAVQEALNKIPKEFGDMGDLNPIITPILDLTKVRLESRNLDQLMSLSTLTPNLSYDQARLISNATQQPSVQEDIVTNVQPTEVKFEQNIYAPEAMSTNDIYRQTKSQITIAKKELGVL